MAVSYSTGLQSITGTAAVLQSGISLEVVSYNVGASTIQILGTVPANKIWRIYSVAMTCGSTSSATTSTRAWIAGRGVNLLTANCANGAAGIVGLATAYGNNFFEMAATDELKLTTQANCAANANVMYIELDA